MSVCLNVFFRGSQGRIAPRCHLHRDTSTIPYTLIMLFLCYATHGFGFQANKIATNFMCVHPHTLTQQPMESRRRRGTGRLLHQPPLSLHMLWLAPKSAVANAGSP